jgi:hypothetical protein
MPHLNFDDTSQPQDAPTSVEQENLGISRIAVKYGTALRAFGLSLVRGAA